MYIAGLHLPFAEPQALNCLAWASLVGPFYFSWPESGINKKVEAKSGKAVHMPTGRRGEYISAAHSLTLLDPAAIFFVIVPPNRFIQPKWLTEYALPEVSSSTYYTVGIGSSALLWLSGVIMSKCFKHLATQWNYISVRERPALIKTGPYAVVRHPMYSCAILTTAGIAGAFWNWIPVSALGLLAALFSIKVPMEESIMLKHDQLGPEYALYSREVSSRVIPYIW